MLRQILPLLVPYVTVGVGLYVFNSAWLAILIYHLGMACVIVLFGRRPPVIDLFKSSNCKAPVIMTLIGAACGVLLFLLEPFLAIPVDIGSYTYSIGLNEQTWPPFIAYYVCVNPFIEEYYWRGLLSGQSSKRLMPTDVFFAGYHLMVLAGKIGVIWLPVIFLLLSFGAWLWRRVNNMSGGLLPSVLSHITTDIVIMIFFYWMVIVR